MSASEAIVVVDVNGHQVRIPDVGDALTLGDQVWEINTDFFSLSRITLKEDEVILVVGAGIGLSTIYLSRLFPRNSIIALEPDLKLFEALNKTINYNGASNVVSICGWVGEAITRTYRSADRPMRRVTGDETLKPGNKYHQSEAPAVALDDIRHLIARSSIGLALVDSRGNEGDMLALLSSLGGSRYLCGAVDSELKRALVESSSSTICESYFWRFHDRIESVCAGRGYKGVFLSVVIPIYNISADLEKCLASLAATKFAGVEFLCVNDGSTDNSAEIVDKWADMDPRFRLINKQNGGCATARNTGLAASRGEYIGLVDGDDWIDESFFDKLISKALETAADIVHAGLVKEYQADGVSEVAKEEWLAAAVDSSGNVTDRGAFFPLQPTIWRRIYRRKFLTHNGLAFHESLRRFDDLPFQFESFMLAKSIALVPNVRYHYRLQRVGQDVAANDRRLFVHFEIFEILRRQILMRRRADVIPNLLQVSENTHNWALQVLLPEFREEYSLLSKQCLDATRRLAAELAN